MGLFGDVFDLNHDGEMDTFELALEFSVITDMEESSDDADEEDEEDEDEDDFFDSDNF